MPEPAIPAQTTFSPPLPSRGTLLGFDFGLARTGVAVGELETGTASPLQTIHAESNDARFAAIARLIDEWHPCLLVVGVPSHPDGSAHELTVRCRRFANQLNGRFNLPTATVDERFSSAGADTLLHEAGVRGWEARKRELDATAAQLILQQFLDSTRHATP